MRDCFRDPIPPLYAAAGLLSGAAIAHLTGDRDAARVLIAQADMSEIRSWTESLWGKKSPYVQVAHIEEKACPPDARVKARMPNLQEKADLHERDGFHCRFCSVPVIRQEVRSRIMALYPDVLFWGKTNLSQHAAFQAMWAQYDHLLPHSYGGDNSLKNMVVTCAPCNYARMSYTLSEVGLSNPLLRSPVHSNWDGLECFR